MLLKVFLLKLILSFILEKKKKNSLLTKHKKKYRNYKL